MRTRISGPKFGMCASALAAVVLSACSGTTSGTTGSGVTPNAAPAHQSKALTAPRLHGNHAVSAVAPVTNGAFIGLKPRTAPSSVYDSIVVNKGKKISSYISSLGFECCSTKEFGDGVIFTHGGGWLQKITLVLSSWGCQSGHWNTDDCSTTPGTTFSEPITMNVYSVSNYPSGPYGVGTLLASQTQTFNIPYRPSKNDTYCTGQNAGAFLGPVDKECDNGLSYRVTYNFRLPKVVLPPAAIVTVAYNTSDAGYNPYGENSTCFTSSGGCGYDALNVSADGNGGFIGNPLDPNGVFVNFGNTGFYCSPSEGTGLILDTPCWTGYHPEINITAI